MNDNENRPVTLITGRAGRRQGGPMDEILVMLLAPDDDTAVQMALEALKAQGYAAAELDRIGDLDEMPEDEPHASAYQGALEGEVSVVTLTGRR